MVMILRKCHVARVPNDIDDLLITRIERVVAADDSRPLHPFKAPLRHYFWVRNQSIDIFPARILLRINKIGEQKTGPGITRFRIRNQKNVVSEYREISARAM